MLRPHCPGVKEISEKLFCYEIFRKHLPVLQRTSIIESMKLRIISHTHWDREWYLPSRYTREWLPLFFSNLADRVSTDDRYRFTLDGQTILIEDALAVAPPTQHDEIRAVAAHPRVAVGPYYQQPDWSLVSPESLIRNLEIGIADAADFGGSIRCGWLMDNFGQISQCPQIHHQFGLDTLYMWRGVTLDPADVRTEYTWRSHDGSAVTAVYLLDSYRNGMQLLSEPTLVAQRINTIAERIEPFSPTGLGLIMNGYDQETEPEDINRGLQNIQEIPQTTPDQYAAELHKELMRLTEAQLPGAALPEVTGEQYSGRYISVFPGILSARTYLKRENYRLETELERYVEPLLVLSGQETQERLLPLWRRVLRNHPHDSICGVSVDMVHQDMEERMERIATEEALHRNHAVSSVTAPSPSSAVVFNPLPWPRREVVETEQGVAIVAAPPLSFVQIPGETSGIHNGAPHAAATFATAALTAAAGENRKENSISNGLLTIQANPDGTVTLTHHLPTGDHVYPGLLTILDAPEWGDTYTSAPGSFNTPASTTALKHVQLYHAPALRQIMELYIEITVPTALTDDRSAPRREHTVVPVVHRITLDTDSSLMRVTTYLRNTARDHCMQLHFPLPAERMERVSAGMPMDEVERNPRGGTPYTGEIQPELERLLLGAREPKPATTLPMRSYLISSNSERSAGAAIYAPGLFEYQFHPAGPAVTILRATGWLARPDVFTRTGDAGPLMQTPGAQCLRDVVVETAFQPLETEDEVAQVPGVAEAIRAPLRVFPRRRCIADTQEAPLSLESRNNIVQLSALCASQKSVVVRLYNPSNQDQPVRITWGSGVVVPSSGCVTTLGGTVLAPFASLSEPLTIPAHGIRRLTWQRAAGSASEHGQPAQTPDGVDATTSTHRGIPQGIHQFLNRIDIPQEVTTEMIAAERQRVAQLRELLHAAETETEEVDTITLERTLVEAELSLMMLTGEDPAVCRDGGMRLHHARIAKRREDYVKSLKGNAR